MSRERMLAESLVTRLPVEPHEPGVVMNSADLQKLHEQNVLDPDLEWVDPNGHVKKIVAHENDRPTIVERKLKSGWTPIHDHEKVLGNFSDAKKYGTEGTIIADAQKKIVAAAKANIDRLAEKARKAAEAEVAAKAPPAK